MARLTFYLIAMMGWSALEVSSASWGRAYFPNIPLTTHEGRQVRFFDDLIEGKIVVINFIYTTCPDTCPLETAQLVRVQELLGDRVGSDLHFYSITIDPENDTVPVLKEYKERFGAKWTFLTGLDADITKLRKKLGLFIPEIPDDSNNHNVNMIIGNQATGRWMKRSPFENPYVLADQIGNWLDGWRRPPEFESYLEAPKLRDLPRGEQIFRTRCASCHTIEGADRPGALGPDLLGVTLRRERRWILDWLKAPDQMLAKKDPIVMAMFEKYNRLAMPNLRLNQEEGHDVLKYLEDETERVLALKKTETRGNVQAVALGRDSQPQAEGNVVAVMNAWIRESRTGSRTNAGYFTLVNVDDADVVLTAVECDAFERVEIHEMAKVDGLRRMRRIEELVVPGGGLALLKPGGKHLMLINAREPIVDGKEIDLTLRFSSGREQPIRLKVSTR